MRPPFLEALPRNSSSEVAPPNSTSDPDGSVAMSQEHSGRPAGSPDESDTEIQQTHDAVSRI